MVKELDLDEKMAIPLLDLSDALHPERRELLLGQLRDALFNVGFLYIKNHGVPEQTISSLTQLVPQLFSIPDSSKLKLSKLNSPHFLGYSGFAEETTLGKKDLREQYDFATELPVVYQEQESEKPVGRDFHKIYWRLRGPNQWPEEKELPGFRTALQKRVIRFLEDRFVHLVEEAFGIPVGTFDSFFSVQPSQLLIPSAQGNDFLPPQHRLKVVKYPAQSGSGESQGVGPHKDSSGWLTFLYQVGTEKGLEVLDKSGGWISADPIPGTFVVNFGNAFEAATAGAVRATVHRVKAPTERVRYSIPFFMGLPLDLTVSEIRSFIPETVRSMKSREDGKSAAEAAVASFLDARWDSLGESQLRKWIRSHQNVGLKWYGSRTVKYYTEG